VKVTRQVKFTSELERMRGHVVHVISATSTLVVLLMPLLVSVMTLSGPAVSPIRSDTVSVVAVALVTVPVTPPPNVTKSVALLIEKPAP
jgi:hypothetical protein